MTPSDTVMGLSMASLPSATLTPPAKGTSWRQAPPPEATNATHRSPDGSDWSARREELNPPGGVMHLSSGGAEGKMHQRANQRRHLHAVVAIAEEALALRPDGRHDDRENERPTRRATRSGARPRDRWRDDDGKKRSGRAPGVVLPEAYHTSSDGSGRREQTFRRRRGGCGI